MDLTEYYRSDAVRARLVEFLGGPTLDAATCYYLAGCRDYDHPSFQARPPKDMQLFLNDTTEVCRSLWDRESLIVHFDVEYVNFDFPAEPYLDPLRTYELQQPIYTGIMEFLGGFDIHPLHVLSGRGHHFVWRISRGCCAFSSLTHITRLSPELQNLYGQAFVPHGESIEPELGAAFDGLGLVMEYVARRVQDETAVHCALPVQFVDLPTLPQQRGREAISLDITEYGDPLHTRVIRVPFGAYLKPWYNGSVPGNIREQIPPMFAVPSGGLGLQGDIAVMRDANRAAELAANTRTFIPDASDAMESLIEKYIRSDTARFHAWFYLQDPEPTYRWPDTYDRYRPEEPEVCNILDNPNDLLLKPHCLRQVIMSLCRHGWHPRHIAGLIRSKYERDYGWLGKWYNYDAGKRADFYTRLFAGSAVLGGDTGADIDRVAAARQVMAFAI